MCINTGANWRIDISLKEISFEKPHYDARKAATVPLPPIGTTRCSIIP